MSPEKKETQENVSTETSPEELAPTNKTFRIICMTFCLGVTLLFLWIWHHQTEFNDLYRKASFLMRNGEAEQAIAAYQRAIRNKNRTLFFTKELSVYNNLGQAYLHAGKYVEAEASFKKVIDMAPDIVEGYVNLTTAYLRQNRPSDARERCLRALQTFPEVALLHYNLACAYALETQLEKASDSLTRAITLNPELKALAAQEDALKQVVSVTR